jgi:hypothetical protein
MAASEVDWETINARLPYDKSAHAERRSAHKEGCYKLIITFSKAG